MKSISYLPGLSFTHNFYINEIKDEFNYNVYSTSPKSKFSINKNGRYFFTPMPFKIISRLSRLSYSEFLKSSDLSIYNKLISISLRKSDVYHCNSCFAHSAFKSKLSNNSLKIVEEQNSHILYCNNTLRKEYLKYNLDFNKGENLIKKRLEEYELADIILVPSDYSVNTFIEMGVSKKKLFKNMLINSKYLNVEKKNTIEDEKVIFGYIGGNVVTKGLIYLLKSLIKNKYNYELHITLEKKYVQKFNYLKKYLNNNIKYLGNFSNMDNFYKNINILVVPSINDGFGMVVIEALSRSIPVIVSNKVGSSEFINSEFGYTFEATNQDQLDYLINEKISKQNIHDLSNKIFNNFYKIKNVFKESSNKLLQLYNY